MSIPTTPAGLRPARDTKQRRSRQTLERILVAAEQLLDQCDFDELTMAELARRAGCAVGTLDGRLPNKESLLVCLHERYLATGIARSEQVFAECRGGGLEARVWALCGLIVDFLAANRGVARAISAHLFDRPGTDAAAFQRRAATGVRQAAAFLAERVDGRVHRDAQQACEFVVLAASELAESRVVFVDRSALKLRYGRKQLVTRIAGMMTAYLRHGGGERGTARRAQKKTKTKTKTKKGGPS